jgi:3-oxoacyl-[acyl-carrier protein] reductase
MSLLDFKDRTVLITGASRGIGAATAIKFAEAGFAGVAINYLGNRAAADKVAESVRRSGAQPLLVQGDVSNERESNSIVQKAIDQFGRLDVLVANAGLWPPNDIRVAELQDSQFQQTIRVNVFGVFYVCRQAAAAMSRARRGSIITVSSTAGQRGEPGHADYAASKGAVISFTKSLAVELGPLNVRANVVAPGWVATDMAADALNDDALLKKLAVEIPLGRLASADDVAGPILFLASDLARHITGEVLNINGGAVLCG